MRLLRPQYIYLQIAILVFLSLLCSCALEREIDEWDSAETSEIRFHGYSGVATEAETRANTSITDITATYYDGVRFHIYEEGKNGLGQNKNGISSYVVPSLYKGTLIPLEGVAPLNWFSRKETHNFWSWTTPWANEDGPTSQPFKINFKDTYISETTNSNANVFETDSWKNGVAFEQCLGTQTGGLNYVENGQFVPLQYRHLMSKIYLAAFVIIDNATASSDSKLKGNITIYGLPRTAMFYPAEKNEDGTPVAPHIVKDATKNESVTYAITNNGKTYKNDAGVSIQNTFITTTTSYTLYDCWYIWPEVDFKDLSFKIEIYEYDTTLGWRRNTTYGLNGAYYGDFSNVKFSRSNNGTNYDDYPNGTDDTVLHAGEYLLLSMNLNTKGNASIRGSIYDWSNTTQNRDAHTHSKDGIYSYIEGKGLSDVMKENDEERIKEYYETFGNNQNTDDDKNDPNYGDNLGIFKLYEDIGYDGSGTSTSSNTAKFNEFYVGDGYILDGMGHTINVSTYSSLKIGPMRDVYLRYYYTGNSIVKECIVYIDKKGRIWLVDPVTYQETPTEFNINDAQSNPFSLNLQTGEISS